MKTRKKIILDEWIGRSAVFVLNIVARILGRLLSIDHSLTRSPRRIVVCKFLGMGSIIQATPLLQTYRRCFPDAEIIFVTSISNKKLLELIPVVDKAITINDRSVSGIFLSTLAALRYLWSKRADIYVDLETYSYFSTALATLSCARNRFGFYRVERNIRMGVHTHMMFFNTRASISQSYLQMARLAGCLDVINDLYSFPRTKTLPEIISTLDPSLSIAFSEPYIVVNPNASDLRLERRWPAEKFVQLITQIRLKHPALNIVLVGSKDEDDYVETIFSAFQNFNENKIFNSAGKLSLEELFTVIGGTKLMITNDTGPMHIAFAKKVKTISLFGPATPAQYGDSTHSFGIYKNVYCSPCVHDFLTPPCCGDNQCMKQIGTEEVLELCNQLLQTGQAAEGQHISSLRFLKNDNRTSLGIVGR